MKQLFSFVFLFVCCTNIFAQTVSENICLNQLGFYPYSKKIAVIKNESASKFYIINNVNNDTVLNGNLSPAIQSKNSSTITRIADFGSLTKQGFYRIYIPAVGNSYLFSIKNNANHTVAVAALKGYYFIRASTPIEKQYAGKWARAEGHPDTTVLIHASAATKERPEGFVIATPGGWYDAGDYNKYVVNSGITMGTLFSAYEDFATYFDTLKTNIPESNDNVPDILNEAIYNLRWMLTMQDPNDGGVYHKCTNAVFDKFIMPADATATRYVVQKGTAATLDFAAVTAQAARILKTFEKQLPGLSDSCLKASEYAWQWALKNPSVEYNQEKMNETYSPKITTGDYGDNNFTDEWFWAACELYATTKNENFYKVIEEKIGSNFSLPSWSNVYALGNYTLVRFEKNSSSHTNDIDKIKKSILKYADTLLEYENETAFKTVMGGKKSDFNWGSNSNAMNESIVLINAYKISSQKKYIDAALTNLDYVLGRNATGYCFITGIGTKSTIYPHHRPSVADGIDEPVPGLMAGGPNPGRQDGCNYIFKEPETAYLDSDCAYASNEIAINWNAPLVYVANAIEALQKKAGYTK